MKFLCLLLVCIVAISSAQEDPRYRTIQLCGADLARTVSRVCYQGDISILGIKNRERNHQQHSQPPTHQHTSAPVVTNPSPKLTIVEMCCYKPCYVKDFLNYCSEA